MENRTSTTIAALPIVEATPVGSKGHHVSTGRSLYVFMIREILTHGHNVSNNGITKSDVPGNGHQDIDRCRGPNARPNNSHNAGWGVVLDFVDDGEHLRRVSHSTSSRERK